MSNPAGCPHMTGPHVCSVCAEVARHRADAPRVARLEQLAQLAAAMREAQQEYFRTRSPESLDTARNLERRLDRALVDLGDRQQSLF